MKQNKLILPVWFTLFGLLLPGCANESHKDHESHIEAQQAAPAHNDDAHTALHLTQKQIEAIGLKLGDPSRVKIDNFVKATGTMGVPPKSIIALSPKMDGILKSDQKLVEGMFLKKGTKIGEVENLDLLKKQQEYLETKAKLAFAKAELKRHESLVMQNAGVPRNLEQAQMEVSVLSVKLNSLKGQLECLGIVPDRLSAANLDYKIPIYSPVSGYVSMVNFHDGKYVNAQEPVLKVIRPDHIHLELDVFEKDLGKIKIGQKITYSVPSYGNELYHGVVSVISKQFDPETKTVRVHGHPEGKHPKFVKDLFIEARIWMDNNSELAVPEEAILQEGQSFFVLAAKPEPQNEEVEFVKIQVSPGATVNGLRAISFLDSLPAGMKIVTRGAYYVWAQSQAGELEHEH